MPTEKYLLAADQVALNLRSGRQIQHRVPMRPQPVWLQGISSWAWRKSERLEWRPFSTSTPEGLLGLIEVAPWQPGDSLYVRETWGLCAYLDGADWFRNSVVGRSEDDIRERWRVEYRCEWGPNQESCFWRPSILIPKWAARTWLKVKRVWVARVQDISEEDARAEGVGLVMADALPEKERRELTNALRRSRRNGFRWMWERLYAGSWERNDWLWCCELELDRERSGLSS